MAQSYATHFNFGVVSATDLSTVFTPLAVTVQNPSAGVFQVTLPASNSSARFYRLTMSLK